MLILSSVASLDVAEGWVGLDDTDIAKIFQCAHVLLLLPIAAIDAEGATILSFQPASAEGQGTKSLIDMAEELLGSRQTERDVRSVEVFHIMRAFHVFYNVSSASSVVRESKRDKVSKISGWKGIGKFKKECETLATL